MIKLEDPNEYEWHDIRMSPAKDSPPNGSIGATVPVRILVVDDQESVRITVRLILETHLAGSLVTEAECGEQGVEMANRQLPNVIIMDIMMPGLDGIGAARQILAAHPEAKIIMFSGYRSRELVTQARECGTFGYLFKPCQPRFLVDAIRDVIAGQTCFPAEEASVA